MALRTPFVRRAAASTAIAVAALAGLTACDLFAPQDTLYIEEASVGVSATVGNVFVGNAVLVQGEGDTANLVTTLVNTGGETEKVTINPSGGEPIEVRRVELVAAVGPDQVAVEAVEQEHHDVARRAHAPRSQGSPRWASNVTAAAVVGP